MSPNVITTSLLIMAILGSCLWCEKALHGASFMHCNQWRSPEKG